MRKLKLIMIIAIIIIIIVFVIAIFLIFKNINQKNIFLGTWESGGGTIYEFKENNEGIMKTSLSEYKFTYKIKDNILSIDFEIERAIDTDYEFTCEENKCNMKSNQGTFVFTKK